MKTREICVALLVVCSVTVIVLNSGSASKARGEENATVSRAGWPVVVLTAHQELDLVRQIRADHQILVDRVAARLRGIQGIAHRDSSDIRLSGVPVAVNGLTGEFEAPTRISLVEEEWIRLAGEIRASECSNLLLNRIANDREVVPVNARSLVPTTFTFHALCQIGEPACREAFKRLPLESDARRRKLFVSLLQAVRGNSKVKSNLTSLLKAKTDEIHRERILLAIAQVDADMATEVR